MKRKSAKIANEILFCLSRVGIVENWNDAFKPELKARLIELIKDFEVGLSPGEERTWIEWINKCLGESSSYFRRDRHLWAAQIHLIADDAVLSIDAAADRVYLRFREQNNSDGFECYFWTWSSELESTREQVTHWQNHFLQVCTTSSIKQNVLLYRTDRVFDSLLVLSRLRYTFDTLGLPAFKCLIAAPSCNMFETRNAIDRELFEHEISLPDKSIQWERFAPELNPTDLIIECLPEPDNGQSGLVPYFEKIINSIANDEPQPLVDGFCLFVSFEFEKRVWKEQEEGIANTIRWLLAHHGSVLLLVNGMTAPIIRPDTDAFLNIKLAEEGLIEKLKGKFGQNLHVVHLHNMSTRQKIRWSKAVDYFVCPAGTAMLFPGYLKKFGTVYGISSFVDAQRWYMNPYGGTNVIPAALVSAVSEDLALSPLHWSTGTDQGQSYSIEPNLFAQNVISHLQSSRLTDNGS